MPLRRKDLERFIKKLRVEGDLGSSMHYILKASLNRIYLSLQICAPDTASGLVLGLPLVNPTRLILFDDAAHTRKNKSVIQLVKFLEESHSPAQPVSAQASVVFPHVQGPQRKSLVVALCSATNVKFASFPQPLVPIPEYFGELVVAPSLQISFVEISIAPLDPLFRPMSSTPVAIADLVWDRVLFFAMICKRPREVVHGKFNFPDPRINSKRIRFLLVSQQFKRLALPYLYEFPIFSFNSLPFLRFSERLTQEPSLGFHLRELHFMDTDSSMNWETFHILAETLGRTLVEFYGVGRFVGYRGRHCLFSRLPHLRKVVMRCPDANCLDVLRTHGSKIEDIDVKKIIFKSYSMFNLCPYVSTLTLDLHTSMNTPLFDTPPEEHFLDGTAFNHPPKCTSLKKLAIDKPGRRAKTADEQEWKTFFSTVMSQFPGLREIHILSAI
ncbi:hypothetical protein C8R44DRAFT_847377 [Mycena epipterygia]|nr:hypothetical protein C8R44DRAFT_847377 [Mycena epipterygia]